MGQGRSEMNIRDEQTVRSQDSQKFITAPASASGDLTVNLEARETMVYFQNLLTAGADADVICNLPAVGECKGRRFSFIVIAQAGNAIFKVHDLDDSIDWSDVDTLDAVGDALVVESDGVSWNTIASDIA